MNSSNLQGKIITYNKPKAEINFSELQQSDWSFKSNYQCPVVDGEAFDLGGNDEWLVVRYGDRSATLDGRLWNEIEDSFPTNTLDSEFPNYKKFMYVYEYAHKSIDEITPSIIQEEKLANTALDEEADVAVMTTFVLGYLAAKATGLQPTEAQVNAYNRQAYVQLKKQQNASNRIELINQLNLGNFNIDISTGWERDNITVGGFPFSN